MKQLKQNITVHQLNKIWEDEYIEKLEIDNIKNLKKTEIIKKLTPRKIMEVLKNVETNMFGEVEIRGSKLFTYGDWKVILHRIGNDPPDDKIDFKEDDEICDVLWEALVYSLKYGNKAYEEYKRESLEQRRTR